MMIEESQRKTRVNKFQTTQVELCCKHYQKDDFPSYPLAYTRKSRVSDLHLCSTQSNSQGWDGVVDST